MQHVLDQLIAAHAAGEHPVYTCLVETRGSTPQKAGAVMLVYRDGRQVGTLGGGCVEAEVKRRALQVAEQSEPELLTFQLDNDYGWDDGLICGGRMTMLIDPAKTPDAVEYFRTYHGLLRAGVTEAVVFDAEKAGCAAASRRLFDREGGLVACREVGAGGQGPAVIQANLKPLVSRPRPYVAQGISYLTNLERCRLVIVGAGHVGQKVAEYAAQVDFDVWVVDDRGDYCNPDRFPAAKTLIVGGVEDVLATLEVDADTFCIIVTRGHNHDEQALFHLAQRPARYVGMIGSKRKIKLILDDLLKQGISRAALDRVHAPIGLDIGSQTVPEIAISIVAQLVQIRNRGGSNGS